MRNEAGDPPREKAGGFVVNVGRISKKSNELVETTNRIAVIARCGGVVHIFKMEKSMKNAIVLAILVLGLANAEGQSKAVTNDALTGLPLMPANAIAKTPVKMPNGQVCKSKMQGNFYSLFSPASYFSKQTTKVSEVIAWYSSHLSGFTKVSGYESGTSQTAFYNSDRTIVIIVTGNPGPAGEDTDAYSIAYEGYQPGLSEKTVASLTQGKIVCN